MSGTASDRSHLSIGEVLTLLQSDFPDITISKIRFLESQGLLDPERTPSGYRKFYDDDIGRLRWILRQQREHFLPLKVIKDRLAAGEVDFSEEDLPGVPRPSAAGEEATASVVGAPASEHTSAPPDARRGARAPEPPGPDVSPAETSRSAASLLQEAPTPRKRAGATSAPPVEAPEPAAAGPSAPASGRGPGQPGGLDAGPSSVSMTLEELLAATGLTAREVADLERFGMLANRPLGATAYYDERALLVAQLAARFRAHGVEARHLRMYQMAAQREVGVFEQILLPLMRKRNASARQEAADLAAQLASLGDALREALVAQLLRDYLHGR
jgi:DNA-binding transcriptional MerR regulator